MSSRIGQLASHLDPRTWSGKGLAAHSVKSDNDVVIVALGRTPFCKARKGQLKDTPYVRHGSGVWLLHLLNPFPLHPQL